MFIENSTGTNLLQLSSPGGGGGTWGYHFEEPRPLTNRERARLFGYPDDFIFEGTITEVRKQIGNSVPPVAAKVVAEHLRPAFEADKIFVINPGAEFDDYREYITSELSGVKKMVLAAN